MASIPRTRAGRPRIPQKRLGKRQAKTVNKLVRAIKAFKLHSSDKAKGETKINARLIARLKKADPRVVNSGIASVSFVGQTYRPGCTLADHGHYTLVAVECKKLHDHSDKRLFKEGLSQANLYLTSSKVVALVLYDFTTGRSYKRGFGAGNSISSRMASRLRQIGLYIVALAT